MMHGHAVLAGAGAVSDPEVSTIDATDVVEIENAFVDEYVSKYIDTGWFGKNPLPVMVTLVTPAPDVGVMVTVGPAACA